MNPGGGAGKVLRGALQYYYNQFCLIIPHIPHVNLYLCKWDSIVKSWNRLKGDRYTDERTLGLII